MHEKEIEKKSYEKKNAEKFEDLIGWQKPEC